MIKHNVLYLGLVTVLGLAACDQYTETNLIQKRAVVSQERYAHEVPAEHVDENFYRAIAHDYRKHGGDGDLYLSFIYHPHSRAHTAMSASKQAAEAARIIRKSGVDNVKTDILPVGDQARDGSVLVSYTRYEAAPPPGCISMPGLDNMALEVDFDYKQGCGIETYLAKQVARPKDLAGRGGLPATSSGKRAANLGRLYDAGIPNEPLEGERASDIDE